MATACLGAGFGLTVPSLNTLAAAFPPRGGGQVRTDTEHVLRPGHGPGAGVRRGVHRPRVLDRPAGARGLPAGQPDRRQPAAAPRSGGSRTNRGPATGPSTRGGRTAPGRVLGLRGVRGPVRVLRDDERELVAAGRHVAWGQVSDRVARADRLLGRGDRGPGAARRDPALAAPRWLPTTACRSCSPLRSCGSRSCRRTYPLLAQAAFSLAGTGLLGVAAAHDQLRAAETGGQPGDGGRRRHRLLPGWLRPRRVRRGPAISAGVGLRRSSRPARPWLSSWSGCPWWPRIASRRPPRCTPARRIRGRGPGQPCEPGKPRPKAHRSSGPPGFARYWRICSRL